jgi:aminocarboxymuconate-semialdehyde decarboxylase
MDRDSVDYQIISNTPILFQYHRPIQQVYPIPPFSVPSFFSQTFQTVDVAQFFNDHALEMVSNSNGRLVTLAQVPLQDTEAACLEASRAMKTGHRGIQIGNHVGPMDLDEDRLVAFLLHCANENVLLAPPPPFFFGFSSPPL